MLNYNNKHKKSSKKNHIRDLFHLKWNILLFLFPKQELYVNPNSTQTAQIAAYSSKSV